MILLGATTTALLLWLAWGGGEFPWTSGTSAGFVAAIVVLFLLFVRHERRAPEPLVRLGLLSNVTYTRGLAVGGMMTFAMMGSTVFLPLYFQLVLGMDPAVAGAMLLPQVGGMMLTSVIGTGAATFLLSAPALGLGLGLGMPNLTVTVQNAAPYRELGAATGMMTFIRSLGGALGVAASGTIMMQHLAAAMSTGHWNAGAIDALSQLSTSQQEIIVEVYHQALMWCFGLSGAVMTVAFVLLFGMPNRALRERIDDPAV